MVEVTTRVGPKGQIVIPKVFRDEYGLAPGKSVTIREERGKLVVERPKVDVMGVLQKIRKRKIEYKPDEWHEEELRERLKRAGIEV